MMGMVMMTSECGDGRVRSIGSDNNLMVVIVVIMILKW
jgi:hypothetical protein